MIGVLASYAVDGRSGVAMRRFAEYEAGGVPFLWDGAVQSPVAAGELLEVPIA